MAAEKNISQQILSALGNRIKKLRVQRGLTMESLGLEVGLTRMQINRIEKGHNVTFKTIVKLAMALKVKPEILVKIKFKYTPDVLEAIVNEMSVRRKK